jgi:hypothetical protein
MFDSLTPWEPPRPDPPDTGARLAVLMLTAQQGVAVACAGCGT